MVRLSAEPPPPIDGEGQGEPANWPWQDPHVAWPADGADLAGRPLRPAGVPRSRPASYAAGVRSPTGSLLRSIRLFGLLPAPTIESLARALVPVTVPSGVDIVSQGDEGSLFYAIADGEVDVIADGTRIATLGRGDHFGEIALMYGMPRTATVRSRVDARLYTLDRETFLVALTGHGASHAAAQRLADGRIEQLRELHGAGYAITREP